MLSVEIAISIFDERENRTIERYRISKVGIGEMFAVKIIVGMIAGCIQFAVSFAFSAFVLGVEWGDKIGWMLLLLMLDNLFAVLLAVLLGMRGRNKSISQDSVLLITMFSAYLGGSVTPVYLLENIPVLRWLVKISPLYWTNQALISLYNDILDEKTLYRAVEYIQEADVLIIAGTSLAVYPAAGLVNYYRGHKLVVINKTPLGDKTRADLVITGAVGETLAQV